MDGPWNMLSFSVMLLVWGRFATGVDIGWEKSTMNVNEGKFDVTTKIKRSTSSGLNIVTVSHLDITAKFGKDYGIQENEDIVFKDGESEKIFHFYIKDDNVVEYDEDFQLKISSNDSVTIGPIATLQVTIASDDKAIFRVYSIGSVSEDGTKMSVTVTKAKICEVTIHIKCSTIAGTATEGVDFTPLKDHILIFGPSVSSLKCEIPIINDDLVEVPETFDLVLRTDDSAIAVIYGPTKKCTINDDDKVIVQFSSNGFSDIEGKGKVTLGFEMIGKVTTMDLIITLQDTPGTAEKVNSSSGEGDYFSWYSGKNITLPKGKNYTTYTVSVANDGVPESNETFTISMQKKSHPFITFGTPTTTTITIIDDDKAAITFAKSADTVDEEAGTLDIILKKTTETELTLKTKVTCIDVTAKKGVDYEDETWPKTWGNAKDENQTITLTVKNNAYVDGERTLKLKLSTETPDKVQFGTEEMEITIINEENVTIAFKSDAVTVNEDVGTATTIELERTGAIPLVDVSVKVTSADGTAKGGKDFVAMKDQVITFKPSDTVKKVPVVIINDNIQEADQLFSLTVRSDDSSVTVGSTSVCAVTIASDSNDLSIFSLSASSYAIAEGDGPVKVVINREQKSEGVDSVKVKLTTSEGTALTGVGKDFAGETYEETFNSNDLSKEISIALFDDDIVELNETFTVTITPIDAATAKIGNIPDATITILNDDKEIFEFSASTFSAKEDTKQAVVTITKAGKATLASHTMTILLSTYDVTANSSSALDYTSVTDLQVNFAPSDTSKSVTITLSEDNIVENDETFKVQLKPFSWLSKIGTTNEATVTIENDDKGNITFHKSTHTVIEGENVTFNFGCSGNNDIDLNFKITASPVVVSHTNSRKADYTLADNTPLTCGPRVLGINYTMPTTQDNNAEWPESFHVDTTTTDTEIIDFAISQTTVTIIDNEDKVNLWIKDAAYNLTEDEGSITMTVMKTDNA
ncbi:adhesion G-protein coupled receptor V1 [Nematostella vectensis]|uniref:adhesion G-protein coupled receptor V1 n=1 Tax=Nematostella vectensis TaxID=45351 RepID=UPI0020777CB8|nr:adhesion G-protein coupled receptor V1 [Nematostella vectensis]